MLLVFFTVSFVILGTCTGEPYEACYGQDFKIPDTYSVHLYKGPLYFTPYNGGPRKTLLDNREAKDPRIKISGLSVILTDLTEKDEGHFGVSFSSDEVIDVITLKILECAAQKERYYGDFLGLRIQSKAAFLEFTPLDSLDHPVILWNRTDRQISKGKRGKVKSTTWLLSGVTQADNGYYNFRRKDRYLVSRYHFTVNVNTNFYDEELDELLFISYPWMTDRSTVSFKPENEEKMRTVIKDGNKVWEDNPFLNRIEIVTDGFEIFPLRSTDDGIFEIRDPQGNLALTAHLHIRTKDIIIPITITVAAVILLLGLCCCCCCCKKKCCKRDKSTPRTAAAPAVYYHDSNQPTDPEYPAAPATPNSSAFRHEPVNSAVFNEPTNASLEPPVYQPTNVDVNPSLSENARLTDPESAPAPSFCVDLLSSTPETRFELKGLSFLSATPLTSDAPSCDVYVSEKLNFL